MLVAACTSRPGKSWRRPKCRLYARGVSVMRAAASCPTVARNISDDDDEDDADRAPSRRFLSLSLRFPLCPLLALFSPLQSTLLPWSSTGLFLLKSSSTTPSSLSPSPYEILVKNLRRDKLLFAWRKSARNISASIK